MHVPISLLIGDVQLTDGEYRNRSRYVQNIRRDRAGFE